MFENIVDDEYMFLVYNLFLPLKLPQAPLDQDECILLNIINQNLVSMNRFQNFNLISNKLQNVLKVFKTWGKNQGSGYLQQNSIKENIKGLLKDEIAVFYLKCQNATLIVHQGPFENDKYTAAVSAFQCSADNESIMSSNNDLIGFYPQCSIYLENNDLIHTTEFAEILENLNFSYVKQFVRDKTENENTEVRDVPSAKGIFDWLIPSISTQNSSVACEFQGVLKKKIRDDVIIKESVFPFRRSGLWMAIKVVIQYILHKTCGEENGLIIYKLIILIILNGLCKNSIQRNLPCDLKSQMIKKLAIRIYKLNTLVTQKSEIALLIKEVVETCFNTITEVKESMQNEFNLVLEKSRSKSAALDYEKISLNDINHDLDNLKLKVENFVRMNSDSDINFKLSEPACSPRNMIDCHFPNLQYFLQQDDLLTVLYDVECWINKIDLSNTIHSSHNYFCLFTTYVQKALHFYELDELGYSRFILTCLKLVSILDKIACDEYKILLEHEIGFNIKTIECLLLPKSSDLNNAYTIIEYINKRSKNSKFGSLIDDKKIDHNSFGVRFFRNTYRESFMMRKLKADILETAKENRRKKILEVEREYKNYLEITNNANDIECEYVRKLFFSYSELIHSNSCKRCALINQAEKMRVKIYEWPLPSSEDESDIVVFELLIPPSICFLREALYILRRQVLCETLKSSPNLCGIWIKNFEVSKHASKCQTIVTFGSVNKPFTKTHYNEMHPSVSAENFIVDNNCTVTLCDITSNSAIKYSNEKKYESLCTFKLTDTYKNLQWTCDSTGHSENEVLAKQYQCDPKLSLREFINFGFLRSGHHLQIRNIICAFEQRSLSFENLSVLSLIQQSVWQVGPLNQKNFILKNSLFYPPSHQDLFNSDVISKLHQVLYNYLQISSRSWDKHLFIYSIIVISSRCISLAADYNSQILMIGLLKEIRKVLSEWIEALNTMLNRLSDEDQSVSKLLNIQESKERLFECSCFMILTYSNDKRIIAQLMKSNEDVDIWLSSMYNINRLCSIINYKSDDIKMVFRRNIFRRVTVCLLDYEDCLLDIIKLDQGSSLSKIFKRKFPDAITHKNLKWSQHKQPAHHWFYNEENGLQISINGSVLIKGMTVGSLPKAIYSHEDFLKVFGQLNFDSYPSGKKYKTQNLKSNEGQQLTYSFFVSNETLILFEIFKDQDCISECIYIPNNLFESILSFKLKEDYSHWFNLKNNTIEFRGKPFNDRKISFELSFKSFQVKNKNGYYTINMNSRTFKEIHSKITHRLDEEQFVDLLTNKEKIFINLRNLGLSFEVDLAEKKVYSTDYRDMIVSESQKLHTLLGLEQGLLLVESTPEKDENTLEQLIIPNGEISIEKPLNSHQVIKIKFLDKLSQNRHVPAYYSYKFDKLFSKLKAEDSINAWLYLALLHACTSHVLPDLFLGITGTEMAFKILQSGYCWSCKPLKEDTLFILHQINKLSPERNFYPKHLKTIQNIKWPSFLPSSAANDAFKLIVNELLDDSFRLSFQYNIKRPKLFELSSNEKLLASKAYYRYLNYYTESTKIACHFKNRLIKKDPLKVVFNTNFSWADDAFTNIRKIMSQKITGQSFDLIYNFYSISSVPTSFDNTLNLSDIDMKIKKTSEWEELINYLEKNFLSFYNYSISTEKALQFYFFLSYMAYKKINIDFLLFIQHINKFKLFYQNIKLPQSIEYSDIHQYDYNHDIIIDCVIKNHIRHTYLYNRLYSDQEKISTGKSFSEQISRNWTCETVANDVFRQFELKVSPTILPIINPLLLKWRNNKILREFFENVNKIHKSILNSDTFCFSWSFKFSEIQGKQSNCSFDLQKDNIIIINFSTKKKSD